ncbi:ABC transporter permease [Solimonas marina]|uniref:ABC transporter permease n=1 Tax=Solimonas marina TaxID=2714601 RepID=A0A969WBR1_9GAMM|nr:ABC transporter permease [Solimonas marina]NKF24242.1 ABC transporter permease [Solimonas marina]
MLRLERRPLPSARMRLLAPLIAALLMFVTGFAVFALLGKDPLAACAVFFVKPLTSLYGLGELLVKTAPLLLCAIGLAIGFRANVWNIGAEGQLTIGALAGTGVALAFGDTESHWILPAMLIAGVLGGMAWAAIPALLRTRFRTSEILTSLMLVYIAQMLLAYLVHGPWRDPDGFNFPQSRMFNDWELLPILVDGTRINLGIVFALLLAGLSWLFTDKTHAGYRLQVAGLAPAAAAYAGFSEKRNVWLALLISGATAGLAGIGEVAGPIGQLQTTVSPGYGFAAIIVAFVGRLNAFGIVLAALLMSLLYLGGEQAQIDLGLPSAITGLFQGLLLFYLLAMDAFVNYRLRRVVRAPAASGAAA